MNLRFGLRILLAVSLATNVAWIARRFAARVSPDTQRTSASSTTEGHSEDTRTGARGVVKPPVFNQSDCAAQQAAGEAALAAVRRDLERHTPVDSKWTRSSTNASLTSAVASRVMAARPDVARDAFAVDCRGTVCRLTAKDAASFSTLTDTPSVRRMAGRPGWGENTVTFDPLPEDTVDGLSFLRDLSAQIEAKGLFEPCGVEGGAGRQRVPVRLTVTAPTESLDQPGIEMLVGTITGNLELSGCVERILRTHLEGLDMPRSVSEATLFSYFYVRQQ
jgi:hypothetical protein